MFRAVQSRSSLFSKQDFSGEIRFPPLGRPHRAAGQEEYDPSVAKGGNCSCTRRGGRVRDNIAECPRPDKARRKCHGLGEIARSFPPACANNKIRARVTLRAEVLPLEINACRCPPSSSLNATLYTFFMPPCCQEHPLRTSSLQN